MAALLMVNKQLHNDTITTSKQAVYNAIRYIIDLFKFKYVLGINGFLFYQRTLLTPAGHIVTVHPIETSLQDIKASQ